MRGTRVWLWPDPAQIAYVDRSVGGIYDRWDYVEEKPDALERWSRELQRIVAAHARLRLVTPR